MDDGLDDFLSTKFICSAFEYFVVIDIIVQILNISIKRKGLYKFADEIVLESY